MLPLTNSQREQIAEVLNSRANEVAAFSDEYRKSEACCSAVGHALHREIERLRSLARAVQPTPEEPTQ